MMRTIFTTEALRPLVARLELGTTLPVVALIAAGAALSSMRGLWSTAIGLELLATSFWLWARRASDAREQLARWSWMRRPAAALWLAAGCHAAMAGIVVGEAAPAARA
ncbi:MAG: hypothetical protein HOP12_11665, partial [Candidatus Eisenbacteria bacterium]|nr:hypothetical protein [Candidatus Eisenbacteria bacterium]